MRNGASQMSAFSVETIACWCVFCYQQRSGYLNADKKVEILVWEFCFPQSSCSGVCRLVLTVMFLLLSISFSLPNGFLHHILPY